MSERKIAELLDEGKTIVSHLIDTNAAGSTDHAAVPKVHLVELLDKLHTARMWLLSLFPGLAAETAKAETAESPQGTTSQAGGADMGLAGEPVEAVVDLNAVAPTAPAEETKADVAPVTEEENTMPAPTEAENTTPAKE